MTRLIDMLPAFRPPCPAERFARAASFVAATGAKVFPGERARYDMRRDVIEVPPETSFENSATYYGVLTHELVHWTRHPSRLDRDFGRQAVGDRGYAMEETVAELGAFFLAADLGLSGLPPVVSWAYIEAWLPPGDDEGAIRKTAHYAEEAVVFLKDAATRRGWS